MSSFHTPEASAPAVAVLSHALRDPECRLGIPGARFTQVNHLATLVLALILTGGLYSLLVFALPSNPVTESLTRNWVSYAIVGLSFWCGLILLVKWRKIRFQSRALTLPIVPSDPDFVLSPLSVDRVMQRMHDLVDNPRMFILTNRIEVALSNLKNMMQISDVDGVLKSQAEADEDSVESSYTIVRGLLWMVPIFGFVGTVLGLAGGIGGFGGVLESAESIETLKPALQRVTGDLSVAFETTLHGLVGALLIHFALTLVRRLEEAFLDNCREFCQTQIVGKLRLSRTELQRGGAE